MTTIYLAFVIIALAYIYQLLVQLNMTLIAILHEVRRQNAKSGKD